MTSDIFIHSRRAGVWGGMEKGMLRGGGKGMDDKVR